MTENVPIAGCHCHDCNEARKQITAAATEGVALPDVGLHRLVSLRRFRTGAIVRHKNGADGYVVTANYGGYAVAVRTTTISNPDEWDVIYEGAG